MTRRFWPFSSKQTAPLPAPAPVAPEGGSTPLAELFPRLQEELREILKDFPRRATLLDVFFAYRLFLGRPPESVDVCRHHAVAPDPKTLANSFLHSPEYRAQEAGAAGPPEVPVMAQLDNGLRIHFYLSDRYVGWNMAAGDYDAPQERAIRQHVKSGFRCIDLGANIGPFTLQMARQVGPGGAVYAFEPFPKNFRLLQRNIEDNGFQGWAKALPYAAHSVPGKVRLFFDHLTQSDYWGVFASEMEQPASFDSMEVERVRLDDVIPAGEKIDFIKMDIEGAEVAAVEGMSGILTTWRPLMLFEFNPRMLKLSSGVGAELLLERLRSIGYRIVDLERFDAGEIREFEYQPERDQYMVANLAAVP